MKRRTKDTAAKKALADERSAAALAAAAAMADLTAAGQRHGCATMADMQRVAAADAEMARLLSITQERCWELAKLEDRMVAEGHLRPGERLIVIKDGRMHLRPAGRGGLAAVLRRTR